MIYEVDVMPLYVLHVLKPEPCSTGDCGRGLQGAGSMEARAAEVTAGMPCDSVTLSLGLYVSNLRYRWLSIRLLTDPGLQKLKDRGVAFSDL